MIDDWRIGGPSLVAFANLGVKDGVCGYAFFFDEFLDL